MSLQPDTNLGSYRVIGPLGAGGMGEVYRAVDAKLDREVAIKVIPDALAHDPQRIARFEREAKVLASLNHPQIAAIHGFEEAEAQRFLVLELVEGSTLEELLADGPLGVPQALDVALQIAEALEAAHEKGIVHRDLKPANVKVTPDGKVKVLDFGLAKAMAEETPDPATSPTITKDFTSPGVILGTAAYMSPEQARGQTVDKRTDIWSFGCVLYECLTGHSIFRGESISDSVGAVLHKQPAWEKLPRHTPAAVKHLTKRCLSKDRAQRLRDIGDARIELQAAIADPTSSTFGDDGLAPVSERRTWPRLLTHLAVAVTCVVLTVMFMRTVARTRGPDPPLRKLMPSLTDATLNDLLSPAKISPNGKRIVYVRDGSLWVQDLDRLVPRMLPQTESALAPFWSPDGESVGYLAGGRMWRVDVAGGSPSAIAELRYPLDIAGGGRAAWLSDGRIMLATGIPAGKGLWQIPAAGGEPALILQPREGERDFESPSSLPGGQGVLFVVDSTAGPADTICVYANGGRKEVFRWEGETLSSPIYSRTGHLLYVRRDAEPSIWAVKFSVDRLQTTGEKPFKVADGRAPSVSDDGTLFYLSGARQTHRLAWVDLTGQIERVVTREQEMGREVSLSLDGTRVLLTAYDNTKRGARRGSIWIHNVASGRANRVTFPPPGVIHHRAVWHPDGQHIVFIQSNWDTGNNESRERSIMMARIDGSGEPIALLDKAAQLAPLPNQFSLSMDGRYLAFDTNMVESNRRRDIAFIDLKDGGKPRFLRSSSAMEREPAISPDGRLLAYSSNESGRDELYLTEFPAARHRWLVSPAGRVRLFWGRDQMNQVLYYVGPRMILYQVTVKFDDGDQEPEIGQPRKLLDLREFDLHSVTLGPARDGKRLMAIQKVDVKTNAVLVENWFSEFKNGSND